MSHADQGFYGSFNRLRDQVFALIDQILAVNWHAVRCVGTHLTACASTHCTNVICTGHSLGAAQSGVAAIEIAVKYNTTLSVCT